MTRFKYELDPETNLVEKSVLETYPSTDSLENGIATGKSPALIKKQQLKALQGKAEAPLVKVEEEWFEKQQLVESLTLEAKTIEDQLSGVEEVIDEETQEVIVEAVEKVTDEAEVEKLQTRLDAINDKIEYYFDDAGVKQNTTIPGELSVATTERAELEEEYEFLKGYRGEETTVVRPEPAAKVKLPKKDVKKLIAHDRDLNVRNNEDSVADIAKMVSLAFSVISTLWEITPDDAKDTIDPDKRGMIDYAVLKFNEIDTRADDQLAEEGTKLIDRLYNREVQIAKIIKNHKD